MSAWKFPCLSHDEAGTLAAARRLWAAIDRPNAMIKIPATAEGIRAFQTLTAEGINVNITCCSACRRWKRCGMPISTA
jgi:transaldolase